MTDTHRGTAFGSWVMNLKRRDVELLRRRRCRWEDNIIMDLQGTGKNGAVDWICLAKEEYILQVVANAVINLRVT